MRTQMIRRSKLFRLSTKTDRCHLGENRPMRLLTAQRAVRPQCADEPSELPEAQLEARYSQLVGQPSVIRSGEVCPSLVKLPRDGHSDFARHPGQCRILDEKVVLLPPS